MMTLSQWGAFGFGLVLGWFLYLINRYRKGDVQLGDITTVVGALGGASVTALFPNGGELFGAYGLGLAVGFFAYFAVLIVLVANSDKFEIEYFLDGRRKNLNSEDFIIPGEWRQPGLAMDAADPSPAVVQAAVAAATAAAIAVRAQADLAPASRTP
jgi:hypothetical protein